MKALYYLHYLWLLVLFFLIIFSAVLLLIFLSIIPEAKAVRIFRSFYLLWGRILNSVTGINFISTGEEHVDFGRSYVIVANHTTKLDVFMIAYCMRMLFKALGKIEIKRIPLIGWAFGAVCIFVKRSNAKSRKKSLEDMKAAAAKGFSILVFPEGTRNPSNRPLINFRDGAFRTAIETGLPILPMIFLNGRWLMPNDGLLLKSGIMECRFLSEVPVEKYTIDDIEILKKKVYDMMKDVIVKEDRIYKTKETAS